MLPVGLQVNLSVSETMLRHISETVKTDPGFVRLLETARENAAIYLLVRRRQKGCDGMGELAMLKEEFRDSLDILLNYCIGRQYLSEDVRYDLDSAADELGEVHQAERAAGSGQK